MITFEQVKKNEAIAEYIRSADKSLIALGYTEHSFAHVGKVVHATEYILSSLGFDREQIETAKIAAYMHDIGNLVNRVDHSQSGAIMAFRILDKMGMEPARIGEIVTAIGNHDEGCGIPVSAVAAALIIADKSDVRRSRVRNSDVTHFDIHDRVNYSVEESQLEIDEARGEIVLSLKIDTDISPIMEYFEIFLNRMILCRKAADKLGLKFKLIINEQPII